MIRVCDAIMGSGKSTCAINYMNEHPGEKFIYISPYLAEGARIKAACPELRFVEPEERFLYTDSEDSDEVEVLDEKQVVMRTKVMHTAELIRHGRNIASTHAAFMNYTTEMLENIRKKGYTLILDEDLDIAGIYNTSSFEMGVLVDSGYVTLENDEYQLVRDSEDAGVFNGLFRILRNRGMTRLRDGKTGLCTIFWHLSPKFFGVFKEVYVLTYLFEGQATYNMFESCGMEYRKIGIRKDETGYHFDDDGDYVPPYVRDLKKKIHICVKRKLNAVGSERNALSASWYKSRPGTAKKMRDNIYNYFHNVVKAKAKDEMWTTFKRQRGLLSGPGYKTRFVPLNMRATNSYADCHYLVYAANVFMNPMIKQYYHKRGLKVNEDLYALSMMVQWIFRSAIRNGEDVWVYVPSKRMRYLLRGWLNDLSGTTDEDALEGLTDAGMGADETLDDDGENDAEDASEGVWEGVSDAEDGEIVMELC